MRRRLAVRREKIGVLTRSGEANYGFFRHGSARRGFSKKVTPYESRLIRLDKEQLIKDGVWNWAK